MIPRNSLRLIRQTSSPSDGDLTVGIPRPHGDLDGCSTSLSILRRLETWEHNRVWARREASS